jgi:hypothetical protein
MTGVGDDADDRRITAGLEVLADAGPQQGCNLGFVKNGFTTSGTRGVRHIMIKKELRRRPGGGGVGLDSPGLF